jgi:hypothetical protein
MNTEYAYGLRPPKARKLNSTHYVCDNPACGKTYHIGPHCPNDPNSEFTLYKRPRQPKLSDLAGQAVTRLLQSWGL